MKIPEKISVLQAKRKLLRLLDASLLAHAAALCSAPQRRTGLLAARTCGNAFPT